MLATIRSAAVIGIDAYDISVEVDCARGLPQFTIVGLAAGAVRESRERVMAAIVNSGFTLPARRTTVNLAPASCPGEKVQPPESDGYRALGDGCSCRT